MKPWILIETVTLDGEKEALHLYQRDTEFSIQLGREELMNSRSHGSEDALGELACNLIQGMVQPRILIGGLGMGFTVASVLKHAPAEAAIQVAELLPAVVQWNHGVLGHLAEHPLNNKRVKIKEIDVTKLIKAEQKVYDAILLDIDNGPTSLVKKSNAWLYSPNGLAVAFAALRPGGVLAVWSAGADANFSRHLEKVGFEVQEKRVKAHGNKGANHVVWLAQRPLKKKPPAVIHPSKAYRPRAPK
jgi:spermidine synthase